LIITVDWCWWISNIDEVARVFARHGELARPVNVVTVNTRKISELVEIGKPLLCLLSAHGAQAVVVLFMRPGGVFAELHAMGEGPAFDMQIAVTLGLRYFAARAPGMPFYDRLPKVIPPSLVEAIANEVQRFLGQRGGADHPGPSVVATGEILRGALWMIPWTWMGRRLRNRSSCDSRPG
jgi:hypothetical protein